VEAMAAGRPVLAYRRGGATETVVENESGLFFNEQTPDAIMSLVRCFLEDLDSGRKVWDSRAIKAHADTYAVSEFKRRMFAFIKSKQALA
jgi:glycosyltransferase involved in cell wall biosynthesis